jgi:hypothetical protein
MGRKRTQSHAYLIRLIALSGFVSGSLVASIAFSTNAAARDYCTSDRQIVANGTLLSDTVQTVFGNQWGGRANPQDPCIQVDLLHYGDADVFLANVPEGDCHACGGALSAYVLQRQNGHMRVVRSFINFANGGAYGVVGKPTAARFARNDALILKSGYSGQGNSYEGVSIYMFQGNQIISLNKQPINLHADNAGAIENSSQVTSVDGEMMIMGEMDQFMIQYSIINRGVGRIEYVSWGLRGGRLEVIQGREPPEFSQLGGP